MKIEDFQLQSNSWDALSVCLFKYKCLFRTEHSYETVYKSNLTDVLIYCFICCFPLWLQDYLLGHVSDQLELCL